MDFNVHDPIDWQAREQPRSYRMYIQAWNFLEPFFVHYSLHQDSKSCDLLLRHVDDWLKKFGNPAAIEHDIRTVRDNPDDEGLFIGHPMAIAGRFYRLAYILDIAARTKTVDTDRIQQYLDALKWHAYFISIDKYFLEQHNHGLQAALSQLIGAERLIKIGSKETLSGYGAIEETYAQGKRRLFKTLSRHICTDGTHKEHSPHYHIVVANAIREPIMNNIITDAIIRDIFNNLVDMARWLFDFKGRIINMGDSDLELLAAGAKHYQDKQWPEKTESRLFEKGGYWFARGTGKFGKHYLAHQAAMHSRTHKHADTGTFIWQDRGHDILVDAGRYGYVGRTKIGSDLFNDGFWYADPRRVYVESTRAHNTLSVDGKNHPRFRAKPFGSAIRASTGKDGIFVCESAIPNLPGMSHFRILALKPGEWLLCLDSIRAADSQSHDFCQHFQIHPDWQAGQNQNRQAEFSKQGDGEEHKLYVSSLFKDAQITDIARGSGNPEKDEADALSGWWSPRHMQIEPCNSLNVKAQGSHVTMATLFTFAPANIDEKFTSFNITRRRLRFGWHCQGKAETLTLDRSQNNTVITIL